jgi:hypothetical protein
VEGPYERGRRALSKDELVAYARKLGVVENSRTWPAGTRRSMADVLFLRSSTRYLEEMKGIADGAAGGAKLDGGKRPSTSSTS